MRGQVSPILAAYGNVDRELIVPVYQRNYSWGEKQVNQLLDDLLELHASTRQKHFFGSLVGDPESSFSWVIIDGQQRLTTVSLTMLAMVRLIEDGVLPVEDDRLAGQIRRNFLERGGDRVGELRLKLSNEDQDTYQRLFNGGQELDPASNLVGNFWHLLDRIPKLGLTADELWSALENLEVMVLDLERDDNAQRIFESLNSTGLALEEADKIRNFVLMGLPHKMQEKVHREFWVPIEKNSDDTSRFLRAYLMTQTTIIPKLAEVYDAFKAYAAKDGRTGEELLEPVREHSRFYHQIMHGGTGNAKVDAGLARLWLSRMDVVIPFVLQLLADWNRGIITEQGLLESLRICETYLFRRWVTGEPTNSLQRTFAAMHREVTRIRPEGVRFSEVLAYLLLRRTGSAIMPPDDAFIESLRTRNFYRVPRLWQRYAFEVLENRDSADVRDISGRLESGDLSVEHIMPQALTEAWAAELGPDHEEIHETWLHRLGNLTVTGYNSTYSNSPFSQKKSIEHGFDSSPYRLNKEVREADRWGLPQLEARTDRLVAEALKYWVLPQTSFEPPAKVMPVEPMGWEQDFTGRVIAGFQFGQAKATVANWRDFSIRIVRELLRIDRDGVYQFVRNRPGPFRLGTFQVGGGVAEIEDGFGWFLSTATMEKVTTLRRMFESLNLDPDELILTLRPDESADAEVAKASADDTKPHPYENLLKFAEPFNELLGAANRDESTDALLAEFRGELTAVLPEGGRLVNDPMSVAGTYPAAFFEGPPESVTDVQVLAILSMLVAAERAFDPGALWRAVVSGDLVRLLERLESADQAPMPE